MVFSLFDKGIVNKDFKKMKEMAKSLPCIIGFDPPKLLSNRE